MYYSGAAVTRASGYYLPSRKFGPECGSSAITYPALTAPAADFHSAITRARGRYLTSRDCFTNPSPASQGGNRTFVSIKRELSRASSNAQSAMPPTQPAVSLCSRFKYWTISARQSGPGAKSNSLNVRYSGSRISHFSPSDTLILTMSEISDIQ